MHLSPYLNVDKEFWKTLKFILVNYQHNQVLEDNLKNSSKVKIWIE